MREKQDGEKEQEKGEKDRKEKENMAGEGERAGKREGIIGKVGRRQ